MTRIADPCPSEPRRPRAWSLLGPAALALLVLLLPACDDDDRADPAPARRAVAIPAPAFTAVDDAMLASGAGEDWPTTGGDLANQRFSRLTQIHRSNVHRLVPVWVYSTGIEGAFETTPVVVGNTLYGTSAGGRVFALNAATGEELWSFDPDPALVTLCCGPRNEGVSVYRGMVYLASPDARLIALNARTGELAWERRLADPAEGYSATMAPVAASGQVFVGVTGERYGVRGFLAAFDAGSGEERWRWYSIPDDSLGWWGEWKTTDPFGTPLDRDIPAERRDSLANPGTWVVGGGGIATSPAYDPETSRVFVNVEGPAPMLAGSLRPGDNLYTGSIVALDARTGNLVWHTQYLPHDVWGLAGGSPPFLFDRGGRRYVAFAGRTGWMYVFDAADGRPILRSDNFVPQEGLFTRHPDEGGLRMVPGVNGGSSGAPVAYDPGSGTAFLGGVHQPMVYTSEPAPYRPGQLWLGGTARFEPGAEQWGTVSAIDLGNGSIRWQRRTPAPVHSGALATDGDLVFVGQGTGTLDAFDAATGQLLWQFPTGAGVHGGPVTYAVAGVQYVVVPSGGSLHFDTPEGDDLIAFALATHRPATIVSDYEATDYNRTGPAFAGQGRVRQVPADSVPDTQGARQPGSVDGTRTPR